MVVLQEAQVVLEEALVVDHQPLHSLIIMVLRHNQLNQETLAHMDLEMRVVVELMEIVLEEVEAAEALVQQELVVALVWADLVLKVVAEAQEKLTLSLMEQLQYFILVVVVVDHLLLDKGQVVEAKVVEALVVGQVLHIQETQVDKRDKQTQVAVVEEEHLQDKQDLMAVKV